METFQGGEEQREIDILSAVGVARMLLSSLQVSIKDGMTPVAGSRKGTRKCAAAVVPT